MTQHPVWLAALGLLGVFLIYISIAGYQLHQRFLVDVLPAGLTGAVLLTATLLDLFGVLA